LLVFIISIVITQGISMGVYYSEKKNEYLQVKHEASILKHSLENSLEHSITATKMLRYIVENDLLNDDFDKVSKEILQQNRYIDALQLVKDSTIIKTYPLKGNEVTIGYTVLRDSIHGSEALISYKRKQLYFEGPFNLRQGGVGVVGRTPIFKNDTLWGFSAVVIRRETLLKAMNLNELDSNANFVYQIEKQNAVNLNRCFFLKTNLSHDTGIYYKTHIPLGNWSLYVKLKNPRYLTYSLTFSIIGCVFSILLAFYFYHLYSLPTKLRRLVKEKTIDLEDANKSLESRAHQLLISNKELEQFAYVASHDLQEPLRMITGFLSQLEKKYNDQLDDKAKQYIHFAIDGAKRMRQIILDLLEFSKIRKLNEIKEIVSIPEIIEEYIVLRNKIIKEKSAVIKFENLPDISSFKVPIQQVFHNLIDNALKYSRDGVNPIVEIKAVDKKNHWEFSIRDNGIGIENESYDKIFLIFQRLHNREEFEGSGIGLAIVNKIVESLNGKIWVESTVGEGSIFYFTIKKN